MKLIICLLSVLAIMWIGSFSMSWLFTLADVAQRQDPNPFGPWFLVPGLVTIISICGAAGCYPAKCVLDGGAKWMP